MFIICYDDEGGLCVPYGWDADCDGAVCAACGPKRTVAVFQSRAEARKAIRISAAFAKLCREQGRPVNDDFTTGLRWVKVLPLVADPGRG